MTENGRPDSPGPHWPHVGVFRYLAKDDRWEWSDAVAMMHGYQPGTVTPTTELVLSHKHPDDKPTVAELIEQVREHGVPFSSRHRIIDTRGKTHVVVVVGDRLRDGDGQIIGTTGFYVDVTDEFDADIRHSVDEIVAQIAKNRAVINQAIGILMLAYGMSADKAFDMLAWRSKQTNVKLRHIAARFVSAVTTASLLPEQVRDQLDRILLTAHKSTEHPVQPGE
ncbi:PAS and ANTAR domain-containing protein [Mycobacterium sp.]|uniref:PAS and ANTAR domain-containing protein n=1 Tax=Mycobacterium sp. TaxID=1785 RepID=UPI002D5A1420|nr:PAS and ANTAR domain-containing protein [Mycobacterium sp.]HZA08781.1 PAS and ANTAR domain-containing protein [Mycobacterium sp.]